MKPRVRKVSLISPTFRYINIYICMGVCMYVCMHACMHACMHVCMYVCREGGSERVHLSFFIKGLVFVRVIAVSCFT